MRWGPKERVGHSGEKDQHKERLGVGKGWNSSPEMGQERRKRVKMRPLGDKAETFRKIVNALVRSLIFALSSRGATG